MLKIIENLPDQILGIKAIGTVTGNDYETVMIPKVEEKLKNQKGIRLLYDLGKEFEGFDVKAIWDDAKIGLIHFSKWEKVAIISEKEWVKGLTKALGYMMPAEVNVYHDNETDKAVEWLKK